MISVKDVIFNKDKIQDSMSLQCTANEIKELNKAIQVIKLLQTNKSEDIQLSENLEVKSKITCQINHKLKDLDTDNIVAKTNTYKLANDGDQKQVQN